MKYNIIYADPPWSYRRTVGQGVVSKKYETMEDKDIYELPISELANTNCALICWITFPKIIEGVTAIQRWGFEIKTLFASWIKINKNFDLSQQSFLPYDSIPSFFGIGSYTRSNCEVCLLAIKGNMHQFVKRNNISSIVFAPITNHSEKPKEVRNMITDLFGDLPRIELFATQKHEGWDSIGYEIDGKDINESLKEIIEK